MKTIGAAHCTGLQIVLHTVPHTVLHTVTHTVLTTVHHTVLHTVHHTILHRVLHTAIEVQAVMWLPNGVTCMAGWPCTAIIMAQTRSAELLIWS